MYLNEFPTQTYPLVVNKIETINISKINGKETVNCWGGSLTRGVGLVIHILKHSHMFYTAYLMVEK